MQKYLQDLGIVAPPLVLSVVGAVECCHISVHVLENQGKTAGGCIMCLASQRDLGFKQTGSFLEPGLHVFFPNGTWSCNFVEEE